LGGEKPVTDLSSPPAPPGARPRRALRFAAAAAGVLGVLGTAGCGIQSSSMKVVGAAPTLQAANDVTSSGNSGGGNQYTLYFFRGDRLTAVTRYTDDTVTQELIVDELIKGPTSTESSAGYSTDIPGDLSVISFTARDQQWNYAYSEPIDMGEKAEIICSIQTNLSDAQSVGTATDGGVSWNSCGDFAEDYGAPALLPNLGSSASPSESGD
jgi:Sporulation and spore germination